MIKVGISVGGVLAAGGIDNQETGENAGRGKDRCIAKVRLYQKKRSNLERSFSVHGIAWGEIFQTRNTIASPCNIKNYQRWLEIIAVHEKIDKFIEKKMINSQYEFNEEQSSHFTRLANKSRWMATGLGFYAISNLYIISQAARKPFTILLSVLMILLSISTALTMLKAGSGFIKITKTQGNDISLMQASNKNLQLSFTLLGWTFILLSIRLIYAAPSLMKATI